LDWFDRITGFEEEDYASTQARLRVDGNALVNEVTGRQWAMGRLEVVSLAELRAPPCGLKGQPSCLG
jgi:hypothetical protein